MAQISQPVSRGNSVLPHDPQSFAHLFQHHPRNPKFVALQPMAIFSVRLPVETDQSSAGFLPVSFHGSRLGRELLGLLDLRIDRAEQLLEIEFDVLQPFG